MLKQAQGLAHQPHALKMGLKSIGVGKIDAVGQDVVIVANIPALVSSATLRYCRMGWELGPEPIEKWEHIKGEMGAYIPEGDIHFVGGDNINVKDGYYLMTNVKISLNGHVEVATTVDTEMIPQKLPISG